MLFTMLPAALIALAALATEPPPGTGTSDGMDVLDRLPGAPETRQAEAPTPPGRAPVRLAGLAQAE